MSIRPVLITISIFSKNYFRQLCLVDKLLDKKRKKNLSIRPVPITISISSKNYFRQVCLLDSVYYYTSTSSFIFQNF